MKRSTLVFLCVLSPLFAEPTKQWSQGNPTADEQYALEVINRIRRDPVGAADFYNVLESVKPVLKAAIRTNTYSPDRSPQLTPEASFRAYVQLQVDQYNSSVSPSNLRTPSPKPPLALYPFFSDQAQAQGSGLINGTTPTLPAFDANSFFSINGAAIPTKVVATKVVEQFGFIAITAPALSGTNATGGTAIFKPGFAPGGGPQNFSRGQLLYVVNYYDPAFSLREAFATTSSALDVYLDDSFVSNTTSSGVFNVRGKTRMIGINISAARTTAPGIGSRVLAVYGTDNEAFQTSDLPFGADTIFITGVVYRDADQDGDYTPGEGVAGVTITPSAGEWFAVTSTSGGYAIPVAKNSGVYTLTAKGNGIELSFVVNVGADSVKADFVPPSAIPAPTITSQPQSQVGAVGSTVILSANAAAAPGGPDPVYLWQLNGRDLDDATAAQLGISNARTPNLTINGIIPTHAGIYSAIVGSGAVGAKTTSSPAIVGVTSNNKVFGFGSEVASDIKHPNGNIYDQVLVGDATANPLYCAIMVRADPNQVTRSSYIDINNDIVQVEFSGAGTLSLVIDNATVPAPPVNYIQAVNYVKGTGHIVISGADETTYVSVFSVGRLNAVDQSLFRSDVTYDGVADISYIAILSTNGKFGGIFTGNTHFSATKGLTGIYAPGVQIVGPVVVGDVSAFDAAVPVLRFGSTTSVKIAGGGLEQANGQPLQISGITQMTLGAGTTSQNVLLPAQTLKTRLYHNGVDVTDQVSINP